MVEECVADSRCLSQVAAPTESCGYTSQPSCELTSAALAGDSCDGKLGCTPGKLSCESTSAALAGDSCDGKLGGVHQGNPHASRLQRPWRVTAATEGWGYTRKPSCESVSAALAGDSSDGRLRVHQKTLTHQGHRLPLLSGRPARDPGPRSELRSCLLYTSPSPRD